MLITLCPTQVLTETHFFLIFIFNWRTIAYNVVLVSSVQHETVISIYIHAI